MENQTPDLSLYNLQSFLDDQLFISWVLQPDEQLSSYWQKAQVIYPETSFLIKQARQIILSLKFNSDSMKEEEQLILWHDIARVTINKKHSVQLRTLWLRNVAAALLAGIIIGISIYLYLNRQISFSSEYGQSKFVMLPDGSEVTLNANSHLRYAADWKKDIPREVWIDGEAFFKVNHLHKRGKIAPADRFIVHAGKVIVEVLGTTFNVNDRRNNVNVTLVSGKVRFSLEHRKFSPVIMRPGETVLYMTIQDSIVKKKADATAYTDWKNGTLHFNHTAATEVFRYIEDNYGYKVVLQSQEISKKILTGSFNSKSLDTLLKAISTSLGISIKKDTVAHQLIVNY